MMTLSQFRARYTGFAAATDALVQAVLDEQETLIGDHWGDFEDTYHGLITAAALTREPQGRASKIDPNLQSKFEREAENMRIAHAYARTRVG